MCFKYIIIIVIILLNAIDNSLQYCSKFGRHLLQHQCVLSPRSKVGPYYLPYHLIRSDIREDRPGIPLKLKLTFTDVNFCEPLSNISVDIWQCDAYGEYSGYNHLHANSADHLRPIDNKTFLRGIQITNENGIAQFTTIFPGWYTGRAIHIHMICYMGGQNIYVGQLYFSNELINKVNRIYPYTNNTEIRFENNEDDWIFTRFKGPETVITNIRPIDGKYLVNGLIGEIIIGLNTFENDSKPQPSG